MDGCRRSVLGDLEQGSSILETDSSISLLEMPWSVSVDRPALTESQNVLPDFVDPLFLDCSFLVPEALRSIVEKMSEKRFVYRFSEDSAFRMIRGSECVYAMDVLDFEKEESADMLSSVVLVVNRSRYRNSAKTKQNSEYRAALEEGRRYLRACDGYAERMNMLYRLQILRGTNFIFVDRSQDLLDAMKMILKHLSSKREHTPKTRMFGALQKTEHLQNLLQSIPGIGKNVAKCLSMHFKTIKELHAFLKKDNGAMKEFRIWSEDERHFRLLGERQCRKIRAVFLGR
ncbi:vesicular transport protein [Biomphalaria pfeifferi]|uniref:Vesicular transport protein n=1 Tax=Biomphalaria pfeifferi TaxID=112525 RepID=A0AAD8AN48_BIOPF|nr:vesicular transport protein [Biomphalaria pfeifferi]